MSAFVAALRELMTGKKDRQPLLPVAQAPTVSPCYCWALDDGFPGIKKCIPCEMQGDHIALQIHPLHPLKTYTPADIARGYDPNMRGRLTIRRLVA